MNLITLKTLLKDVFDAMDLLHRSNAGVYGPTDLAPTAGAGLTVNVASGTYFKNGSLTAVTYNSGSVTMNAGDPNNPRYDIVYLDNTNTLQKGTGTAASTNPVPIAWPASSLPIAIIFVPANAADLLNSGAATSGFIQDVRQFYAKHAGAHNSGGQDVLAAATATTTGLVPVPPNNTTTFFRGDATFAAAVSGGTPAVVLGTAAAAGVANTYVRDDDTIIAFDTTSPAAVAYAAAVGTATVASRRDHVHAVSLATLTNQLGADVALTNANTWYDGPSVTLLSGKKYLVTATCTFLPSGTSNQLALRLYDGTTTFVSTESQESAANYVISLTVGWVITGTGVAVRAQGLSNSTGDKMIAALYTNGVGNNASSIVAVQIG